MRSVVGLTVAALVAVPLAACAQDPEGLPPSTQGEGGSSSSSFSPTSAAADPELEVVKERALNFENTRLAIGKDLDRSIDDISLVARGSASGQAKQIAQAQRAEGRTVSGTIEYRDVQVKMLKAGERPRAQVQMCSDATKYVIKDAKGKVHKPKFGPTAVIKDTLEQWGDTWYVVKTEGEPQDC